MASLQGFVFVLKLIMAAAAAGRCLGGYTLKFFRFFSGERPGSRDGRLILRKRAEVV
jgi:hypothetical protein